jgi:protein-arginine kinase
MSNEQLAAILKTFCGKDHLLRYDITNPFVRDGWMIAMDGSILVMAPVKCEDSIPRVLPFPSIEKMIEAANEVDDSEEELPQSFESEITDVDFQTVEVTQIGSCRVRTDYLRKIISHIPGPLIYSTSETMLVASNEQDWLVIIMGIDE